MRRNGESEFITLYPINMLNGTVIPTREGDSAPRSQAREPTTGCERKPEDIGFWVMRRVQT